MTYFEVFGDDITQLGQTICGVAWEFSNKNDFKKYLVLYFLLKSKDWKIFREIMDALEFKCDFKMVN